VNKPYAWNRLVKIKQAPNDIGVYEYNGLNWRTVRRTDGNTFTVATDDERRYYYSASWQVVEERFDEDYSGSPGVNRIVQQEGLRNRACLDQSDDDLQDAHFEEMGNVAEVAVVEDNVQPGDLGIHLSAASTTQRFVSAVDDRSIVGRLLSEQRAPEIRAL